MITIRKKLCAVLLLIVMLLSSTTGCNKIVINDNKSMQANNLSQLELSKDNMTKTIREITTHPRAVNSEQIKVVEEYLIKQFKSYGYTEIDKQQFFYNNDNNENAIRRSSQPDIYLTPTANLTNADGVGNNIIVTKRVADTTKELILSAHYDSTENSYGVNDNASGVAVVLELARVLSDIELPYNLKFIMFSGEEKYMLGSRWYVNTLSEEERKNIIGVINIDTIAEKSNLGYMLMLHGDKKIENNQYTDEDLKRLADVNKNSISELFEDENRFIPTMAMNSDHYPFSLVGIPAVSIVQDWKDGINANSSEDVFEKIDADRLHEIALKVLEILPNIC